MGKIAWYKRDPRAALTGMMGLTLEEKGAYNTVLDLIYDRDGKLPDDDRFIAGFCGCDVRVWKRLRQVLIDKGKLYVEGGLIRNRRADAGVLDALGRLEHAANAGRTSAHKRKAETKENKDIASTTVATGASTNKNKNKKEDSVSYETERSAAPPLTAKQVLWAEMKAQVGGKKAGSLIGKWVQLYTFESVAACHFRAMADPPADYVTWMTKALASRKNGRGPPYGGGNGNHGPDEAIVERFIDNVADRIPDDELDFSPRSRTQPFESHLRLAHSA